MLTSYLYANHLLGDCVKSTRGLTNATLQWVEETMLLPQSKLAKFPPPQA